MTSIRAKIIDITPTPFLCAGSGGLRQIARVTIRHEGPAGAGSLRLTAQGHAMTADIPVARGESVVEGGVMEVTAPCELSCELFICGTLTDRKCVPWQPPRRWVVHVVQLSHHDVGYTDLAAHVIPEHDRWLDAVIDLAVATREFPEEAKFRAVVEQAWSIDHFLHNARHERAAAMLELLRCGDIELTALFGNMVTELCGHETLARCVYHAFRLKRDYGIPIISAEHNDIPGFSWGLSQVLTEAGVRIFCPGLPKYYAWGHPGASSFWDEAAIFGAEGMPGAFWWEAPTGKRILFWSNNQGCGGGCRADLPGLAARLQQLAGGGYPYTVLRWPVSGGARDNSPYIDGYAQTIRAWNSRWAYPRLVSSTNARFYRDLLPQLPSALPVFRGELPGQDYPVGTTSTAAATGVNRRNHSDLPAAEALATMAAAITDYQYQDVLIFQAYEEVLWHDEHSWGHHFPWGSTASASEFEKAVHAHRAAALVHDVASKAMARVADAVRLEHADIHLVVFNSLPQPRSGLVSTPLREIDNCGSTMAQMPEGNLRGVLLKDRWHVNPPPEIVAGKFDLIDVESGAVAPYQITELNSPLAPTPHAAQRMGLGAGGKRYGFFEQPAGLKRMLSFRAEAVPPLGYRTYRLRPRGDSPAFTAAITVSATVLENAFYRLEVDQRTGFVTSLRDKELKRELVDPRAPHPFGAILVRDPNGGEWVSSCERISIGENGPLSASLRIVCAAPGHPRIEQTYALHTGEKRIDVAVHLLKDSTPLLEAYLAFPFNLSAGRFRYEGPLCIVDPAADLLPGAYADRLTVQNWVAVSDEAGSVLWSSHEAPVVSLARFWPGRVSPAHSAVVRRDIEHPCQSAGDLRGGAIYSLLASNNFGTNFAVSQTGNLLFRYSITTAPGEVSGSRAAALGRQMVTPMPTIFTKHPGPRPLPPVSSFLAMDNPAVQLVALKRAEDGRGLIIRVWNTSNDPARASVSLPALAVTGAVRTSLAEEDTAAELPCAGQRVDVVLNPMEVATIRIRFRDGCLT